MPVKEESFHDKFIRILGVESEKEYLTRGRSENAGKGKDMTGYQALFNKKKGYAQHLIDVHGIHSKKQLLHFLRDGNRYIQKNAFPYEDKEHMIDPAHRCERHDRPFLLPHERDIPNPAIPRASS